MRRPAALFFWRGFSAIVGVLCLLSAHPAAAQSPPVSVSGNPETPQNRPVPAELALANAIRVDGELTDAVWQSAPVVSEFVQREPNEGMPPTFKTEARVAYDESMLYVAVRAYDPQPDKIIAFLTRRDTGSASDWIHVIVDSYHDRRTAYEFAVNPLGVKRDWYRFNDGDSDDSWDAVWDVIVGRDAEGWRADFKIPLSQLRFSRDGGDRVGFAVVREIARLNETVTWPLLPRSAVGYVSSFGELAGVGAGSKSKRLEFMPYVVGQFHSLPIAEGNPLEDQHGQKASVGADVKYAVTPALNLTATVNPDFGQVEADPATVNLSAFETFFDERRPFFVEGSGTYRFGIACFDAPCSLFYSRRIGRQPRGFAAAPDGGFAVQPLQSTILGAAKLTGRVGKFAVGALTAVTQEERADIALGSARNTQVVEPATIYSVTRMRREYANQSALGFMLTSTNRRIADSVSFLPDSAVTGAVDYDWRFAKQFSLEGYWSGSTVRGTTTAITALQSNNVHSFQRPDATNLDLDPVAESLSGHSGSVAVNKLAGSRIRFNSNIGYKTPGFETNDLGFLRRADEINQSNWLQIKRENAGKYLRSRYLNFNQWSGHNFAGDKLFSGYNVNTHWNFRNFWRTGGGLNFNQRGFDDRLTRGGPGGYTVGNINSWQYLGTDDRKMFGFYWDSWMRRDAEGFKAWNVNPKLVIRPTSAASAEVGVLYARTADDAQWVGAVPRADGQHYTFAHLDQTTSAITLRGNYTMRPTLSLQLYAQPFVSTGDYTGYKELVNGRADAYADRYRPFDYGGNADFRYVSFRTTNVLRWEYKPGSTLFIVWQQNGERSDQVGTFDFGRDYGRAFATPSTNTLLVKLAYWFNP